MKLADEEAALVKADGDISDADKRIRRQEALIEELKRDKHSTDMANELLATMISTRQTMLEHREIIAQTIHDMKTGRR